jgi:hypothetical protein
MDAHVYPAGTLRPTKLRLRSTDAAAAMHEVAKDPNVPALSVVLLVEKGDTTHRFVSTVKGPIRLSAPESDRLIKERDPGVRMRMMAEISRVGAARR